MEAMQASRMAMAEPTVGCQVDYQWDRAADLVGRLEAEMSMLTEALGDVSRPAAPMEEYAALRDPDEAMRSPLAGRTAALNDRLQMLLDRVAGLRERLDFSNR